MEKFEKKHRLLNRKDFTGLFGALKIKKSNFIYAYVKTNNFGYSRIGISSPKRVGNAVYRNSIKRVIRETFRSSIVKSDSYDILFVASSMRLNKERSLNINNINLQNEVSKILLAISSL